jgi:hypothetical protein
MPFRRQNLEDNALSLENNRIIFINGQELIQSGGGLLSNSEKK